MLKTNIKMKELVEQLASVNIVGIDANTNGKSHYYKDANDFLPLKHIRLPTQMKQFYSIVFDAKKSGCIVNETAEKTYQRNGLRYLRLVKNDKNQYMTARNTDGFLTTPDGIYDYIISNDNNVCEIRMGKDIPHFYLNGKRYNNIILAGEIEFKCVDGVSEILYLNDKSGGFHIKDVDPDILHLKLASIRKAVEAVGIPLEKFKLPFEQYPLICPVFLNRKESIAKLKLLSVDMPDANKILYNTKVKNSKESPF